VPILSRGCQFGTGTSPELSGYKTVYMNLGLPDHDVKGYMRVRVAICFCATKVTPQSNSVSRSIRVVAKPRTTKKNLKLPRAKLFLDLILAFVYCKRPLSPFQIAAFGMQTISLVLKHESRFIALSFFPYHLPAPFGAFGLFYSSQVVLQHKRSSFVELSASPSSASCNIASLLPLWQRISQAPCLQ